MHVLVRDAILACHPSMQSELAANVVLAGGTTMLPGFASRLQKELTKVSPGGWKVLAADGTLQARDRFVGGRLSWLCEVQNSAMIRACRLTKPLA